MTPGAAGAAIPVERRPATKADRPTPHEWIWAPIAAIALLAARLLPLDRLPILFCPFHALTGLPCLSCGGTRAMMALARGDLGTAIAMNPLVALVGIGGAAYIVHALGVGLLGWRAWRPQARTEAGRRALRLAALGAVGLNWAYLIAVGR